MFIDFLTAKFAENLDKEAVISKGRRYKYKWLLQHISLLNDMVNSMKLRPGAAIAVQADCTLLPLSDEIEGDGIGIGEKGALFAR